MSSFRFEIIHQSKKSAARVGRLYTTHGIIDTPNFVPVATNASIKALESSATDRLGIQLIFCNTYHLLLHPGPEVVRQAGGLHRFMNRKNPIITDSGGFQVFSLAYGSVAHELKSRGTKKTDSSVLKISEEGVLFRSYRDGKEIFLTPEYSVEIQKALGADIIIPLDELPPYHIGKEALKESFDRTHRWEKRSLDAHSASLQGQAMYAVIHGGLDRELRKESCRVLTALPFDGFSIGGSLGKTRQEMMELVRDMRPLIAPEYPIHLLGIGDLESLAGCIPYGIDTFDSSYPTKAARHGTLLKDSGEIRIKQAVYKQDFGPIDDTCPCVTCQNYSTAYLHHLFKAKELAYLTLATVHNLAYMARLMERYRLRILQDAC